MFTRAPPYLPFCSCGNVPFTIGILTRFFFASSTALAIALATKAVGAILVYAIMVAPAAASNELVKSVRGVIISVFFIALIAELAGIATSFVVFVSPSAIAGILAALSYILALQIKRVKERVHVDIDDPELASADLKATWTQPAAHDHDDRHEH